MKSISLIKDKKLLKSVFVLSLPIALQNLIAFSINMADVFMVQKLGEKELSACSLANIPFIIFYFIILGIGGGACVLCSQYYGKGDIKAIKKIITVALDFTLCVGGTFSFILFSKPVWVMSLLTKNQAIITMGASYLKIVAFSYILTGFISIYMFVLKSVKTIRISLILEILALTINIVLNYVLIFQHLGAPALGIRGAAIATLISRIVAFGVCVWYLQVKETKINFRLNDLFKPEKEFIIKFFKISSTIIISESLWGAGTALNNVVFSKDGSQGLIAAAQIMNMVMQLSIIFITGFADAAGVIIGQLIGKGEKEKVKNTAKILVMFSAIVGLVSSGMILLIKKPIINWGPLSAETRSLALQLINLHAIIIIFQDIAITCIAGILKGGADTKTVLILDSALLWLVSVPLTWGCYIFKFSPLIIYVCTRIDVFVKLFFAIRRLKGDKWIHNVVKTSEAS